MGGADDGNRHKPEPFLDVRVHDLSLSPGLTGLCVGYELGKWRAEQLVEHAMDWLPEFALTYTERQNLGSGNAVQLLRKAASVIYNTEKFQRRGEFGELLLHIAVRQVFDSEPAISKIYYKTASNDTVKGFDAVHVVESGVDLELWLGEAKFYDSISAAINHVVAELVDHTKVDYLRTEFALIANKIDESWPHAQALRKLLSRNTSLDTVFSRACIPVLLTYDSDVIASHDCCNDDYIKAFEKEVRKHRVAFAGQELPKKIRIHLFLLPLKSKVELVTLLDGKLKIWQNI